MSHDGIDWLRGDGLVEGHRGSAKDGDVGVVLGPNSDSWWALDTCHLAVSDVQVRSRQYMMCKSQAVNVLQQLLVVCDAVA